MTVQPFGDRIAVADPPSPPDRAGDLIVVRNEVELDVGVVVTNHHYVAEFEAMRAYGLLSDSGGLAAIQPGALVWYVRGMYVEVKDVKIIDAAHIVAWEG